MSVIPSKQNNLVSIFQVKCLEPPGTYDIHSGVDFITFTGSTANAESFTVLPRAIRGIVSLPSDDRTIVTCTVTDPYLCAFSFHNLIVFECGNDEVGEMRHNLKPRDFENMFNLDYNLRWGNMADVLRRFFVMINLYGTRVVPQAPSGFHSVDGGKFIGDSYVLENTSARRRCPNREYLGTAPSSNKTKCQLYILQESVAVASSSRVMIMEYEKLKKVNFGTTPKSNNVAHVVLKSKREKRDVLVLSIPRVEQRGLEQYFANLGICKNPPLLERELYNDEDVVRLSGTGEDNVVNPKTTPKKPRHARKNVTKRVSSKNDATTPTACDVEQSVVIEKTKHGIKHQSNKQIAPTHNGAFTMTNTTDELDKILAGDYEFGPFDKMDQFELLHYVTFCVNVINDVKYLRRQKKKKVRKPRNPDRLPSLVIQELNEKHLLPIVDKWRPLTVNWGGIGKKHSCKSYYTGQYKLEVKQRDAALYEESTDE